MLQSSGAGSPLDVVLAAPTFSKEWAETAARWYAYGTDWDARLSRKARSPAEPPLFAT